LHDVPETFLAWRSIQVHSAVGPVRRGSRWWRRCTATASATASSSACAPLSAAFAAGGWVLSRQSGWQNQQAEQSSDHEKVKPMISHF
jgi:hypothetical protein